MAQSALKSHLSVVGGNPAPLDAPESHTPLAEALGCGRLVELSGRGASGRTSTTVALLRAIQNEGDSCAWIQARGGSLYPPDLEMAGIDLEALLVVQLPARAGVHGRLRAAELLLRSGALGLVILDLEDEAPSGPPAAWQGRLLGLARQHQSRVVLLTRNPAHRASLGPLIGLRLEARRQRLAPGRFELGAQVLKNKSGAPLRIASTPHRGPWGLR